MAWIFDTYSRNKGHSVLGVVTGKPLTIGGSLGREEATARGALYVIADALEEEGKAFEGLRVAVQGFGKVNARLNEIVTRAFKETAETRAKQGTSMRLAAYGLAVRRVAEATVARGLYP